MHTHWILNHSHDGDAIRAGDCLDDFAAFFIDSTHTVKIGSDCLHLYLRVLPALQIPVWWMFVWVPVGFFVTGVQYALTAAKNMIEKDVYLSTNVLEGYDETEAEV